MIKHCLIFNFFLLVLASAGASAQQRISDTKPVPASKQQVAAPAKPAVPAAESVQTKESNSAKSQAAPAPPAHVPLRPVVSERGTPGETKPVQPAEQAKPARKKMGMVARPHTAEPKLAK